ncbi:MAG: DUF2505 family protein [Spongiibacteraceae bacterium]
MPTTQSQFPASQQEIFKLLTNTEYLVARSESIGEKNVSASVTQDGEDTVVNMHLERHLELPKALAKLFHPHQSIDIVERWNKQGEAIVGFSEFLVENRPVVISTTSTITNTDTGSQIAMSVAAKANIPLIGKKVEKFINEVFIKGIEQSFDYLNEHLNKNAG